MLRTNDITECTMELESIETELQELIEKMRLGTISQKENSTQHVVINKTDKLRELMQRCKKLINTILVLDDYVMIDDNITKYIQENLPFLNANKNSFEDEQLYQHYSILLENLTVIVDNLREQLPDNMHF